MGLQEQERDVTRFLWLKDPTETSLEDNLQVYRFCRVPFGVISSPFLLGATISFHLRSSDNPIAKILLRDIYVENLITGVGTIDEAKLLYDVAKSLFETASMNLREWTSNCKEFRSLIPYQYQAVQSNQKVLGVYWNTVDDTISIPSTDMEVTSTKREILQRISSVLIHYDIFHPRF